MIQITRKDYIRGIVGTLLVGVFMWSQTTDITHIPAAMVGSLIGIYVVHWWEKRKNSPVEDT